MTDPAQQPQRQLQTVSLPVHPSATRLPPTAVVEVVAPDDPQDAVVLLRDDRGVWRAILLPPQSVWELRPQRSPLWTPGMPS